MGEYVKLYKDFLNELSTLELNNTKLYEKDSYPLYELSSNSTLFHRSMHKFNVGDVIKPKLDNKGNHWLQSSSMEIALEKLRQKDFKDRPSRFNCVYTSVIPRSRFVDKGYLYVVEPIGNIFMTDSRLIDQIDHEFISNLNRYTYDYDEQVELIKKVRAGEKNAIEELLWSLPYNAHVYWEGVKSLRGRIEDIEVLCDACRVTEVINDNRLKIGDEIKINKEGVKGQLSLFFNSKNNSKKEFSNKEVEKMVADISKEVFNKPNVEKKTYTKTGEGINGSDEHVYEISGIIRKNTRFVVTSVKTNIYDKTQEGRYRFTSLTLDFYLGKKLYKRSDKSPLFRFDISHYNNKGIYDISSFFSIR